jgi:gamma-glutamyltranspeptidase/glutathione hydrolase
MIRLSAGAAALALLASCGGDGGTASFSAPSPFAAAPPPGLNATTFPTGWAAKELQYFGRQVVSAANPLAVDAGVEILRAGGSAVDAAIATQMVLGLVEPQSSGIGGGAFLIHYRARDRSLVSYDGRETAPAAATPELFIGANGQPLPFATAVVGGRSVGVPGLVRMLKLAHDEHGRLPWSRLFDRAIQLATDGFAVSPRLNALLTSDAAMRTQEPAASYFYDANGQPRPVGYVLRNPEYAATLRAIAADANALYTGPLAQQIVDKVRGHPTNPGVMQLSDLAGYQAKKRTPVCIVYRVRWNVCGMGPPSSGALTVGQALGILENFDLAPMGPNTVDSVHLISEAYRLAYADRGQYMADADFVNVPVAGLLDKNYLKSRAALISMSRSLGAAPVGTPPGAPSATTGQDATVERGGTSHMSIVDAEGNVVSMTTTIEGAFGSRQMVGGFLLNNELTDFSFLPTDAQGRPIANRVEAGKRPRSSMSPTIVLNPNNEVEIVIGSPGGAAIIQYVTKSLIGMIDWRLSPQDAIELGNFGATTSATTTLERNSAVQATAIQDGLRARGHTISIADQTSGLHGFMFVGGRGEAQIGVLPAVTWAAGADPRREGVSRGD